MNRTLATTIRVLNQLRRDHRTLALILIVPSILLIVLYYVFDDARPQYNAVAPLLLGIIPFTLMFIVTSVAMLRERTSGTLERLMTMPVSRLELIMGYALAFALLALLQAALASFVVLGLFGVPIAGSTPSLLSVAVLSGLLGMSLGLFASAFARNEFQAVQFMPAFVLPQFLTCGLFIPRDHMAVIIRWFSDVMPLTYVVNAMKEVMNKTNITGTLILDAGIVVAFTLGALVLGASSLRKRS